MCIRDRPVARRESAPWPPPQPIGTMQEAPQANGVVQRGSGPTLRFPLEFFPTDLSMGLLCVGHQSRYLELCSAPTVVVDAVASCSLSWAVKADASSRGNRQGVIKMIISSVVPIHCCYHSPVFNHPLVYLV